MASGKRYREIRATAFPDGDVEETTTAELRLIMEDHGVRLGERLIPCRSRVPSDLPFDALLKVNMRKHGWHWVVWDHERQKVLDPKRPPYKRLKFVSYVRLYQHESE